MPPRLFLFLFSSTDLCSSLFNKLKIIDRSFVSEIFQALVRSYFQLNKFRLLFVFCSRKVSIIRGIRGEIGIDKVKTYIYYESWSRELSQQELPGCHQGLLSIRKSVNYKRFCSQFREHGEPCFVSARKSLRKMISRIHVNLRGNLV